MVTMRSYLRGGMANVLLGIHCVVPECASTLRRVNQWKVKACLKSNHKGKTHAQCMCPEPYQFFKFPSEVKLQRLWLERVKRQDLEVNNLTRVCSLHFVDGRPTRRHYFPNINLQQGDEEKYEGVGNAAEQQECYEQVGGKHDVKNVAPPSVRKERNSAVSIVPMELLQKQGNEDIVDRQEEEEESGYGGNLTISRLNYRNDVDAYKAPNNSVTITRVTSNPILYTKPANRFINANKVTSAGNRFLRNIHSGNPTPSFVTSNKLQPVPLSSTAQPSPLIRKLTEANCQPCHTDVYSNVHQGQHQQNQEEENDACPYVIDMVLEEEEIEDSSDLSDIGIDIQSTPKMKQPLNTRDPYVTKTNSALVTTSCDLTTATTIDKTSPLKDLSPLTKPKLIPVLAVAPKSQLPQDQGIGPQAIARTKTAVLVHKEPNSSTKSMSLPGAVLVTSSVTKPFSNSNAKETFAVSKTHANSSLSPHQFTSTGDPSSNTNILCSSSSSSPTLATYDPTKQQLQIANPVKYIQECHSRIAQLLEEKGQLETRNMELESRIQELQKNNNDLRREIVHQALNGDRRTPQHPNDPTFNLVPSALLNVSCMPISSHDESQNDNLDTAKPRFRYVIRRPPSDTSSKK